MSKIRIDSMKPEHWPEVEKIYLSGIATGLATFESDSPSYKVWDDKFLKSCRLIALKENQVVGWAALQPVSNRKVYAGVAEETLYIHPDFHNMGVGSLLLQSIINESEENGFWMLTATIIEGNEISIHLHQKLGFKVVGIRERIAFHQGKWTSTILMDRRSHVVGV